MVEEKFMLLSLEDSRMKSLSKVLGNKTCKKIIDFLAENEEASQKDLSDALEVPLNTVEYNIKKLVESGLVQRRKNFFWSKKGKKIVMYELSQKSIVISPRKSVREKLKTLVPAFMLAIVGSFVAFVYEKIKFSGKIGSEVLAKGSDIVLESASSANSFYTYGASNEVARVAVTRATNSVGYSPGHLWLWFFTGALLVLLAVSIINWRKL